MTGFTVFSLSLDVQKWISVSLLPAFGRFTTFNKGVRALQKQAEKRLQTARPKKPHTRF
jgi:hypothetical protein